jgi:hypothetical protein
MSALIWFCVSDDPILRSNLIAFCTGRLATGYLQIGDG